MIRKILPRDFKAIPYLETSGLMKSHPDGVQFDVVRPNVVVGPNGAGKSALIGALALHCLSHFSWRSSLDRHYLGQDKFWTKGDWWRDMPEFLPGIGCDGDLAPALYYRPGHIPGNDDSVTAAMMCGYFELAKEYGRQTDKRSSGQGCLARLDAIRAFLRGEEGGVMLAEYALDDWRAGRVPKKVGHGDSTYDLRAEVLKVRAAAGAEALAGGSKPVVLMDEPEQSLDALAEACLWRELSQCSDRCPAQVIIATHSLYPIMRPERFNLIEAVPGYIERVRSEMGLVP